jgi:hypothetical protein
MRTTCNGLTGFDSLTFRQVYGVENTVMVDRSWYSVLRDWQLRQVYVVCLHRKEIGPTLCNPIEQTVIQSSGDCSTLR